MHPPRQQSERRATSRFQPHSLCYVRLFCLTDVGWITYDGLVLDANETHVRVCSDMPEAKQFRLCHQSENDIRRARETRRGLDGVVFEIGEPVEQPDIAHVENDFSFLDALHDMIVSAER